MSQLAPGSPRTTIRLAGLVVAAIVALGACASLPPPPVAPAPGQVAATPAPLPLAGTTWELAALGGQPPAAGSTITLAFADGRLSGFAGCNSYGGEYTIEADQLRPDMLAQTLMACLEPGLMAQEQAYMQALTGGGRLNLSGDRLELRDEAGGATLVFVPQAEWLAQDVAALGGATWQLIDMDGTAPRTGSTITVVFESPVPAGRLRGNAGCRTYQGQYAASATGISVLSIEMLGEVCASEELLAQEGHFTTLLGWLGRYRIDGDQLELYTQRGEVLRFAKMPSGAPQLTPSTPLATPPAPAG